jgi:hypothetical protein
MVRQGRWVFLAVVLWATPAYAQAHAGIRAGLSIDPDQFFFGGHIETRPLLDNLTFRPNVEVGIGDNLTLVAFNIEFAYWVPVRNSNWRLYFGAGPALVIASFHDDFPGSRDSDAGGGFNILVGAQHRRNLFVELKVGMIDSPELKVTVGYVLK